MFLHHTQLGAHTHTHGRTPLNEGSARRRGRYLHNTQQTTETNIHVFKGMRTQSNRRLIPHDQRDTNAITTTTTTTNNNNNNNMKE
jgi:hypothetical protein